jgi:AraC-like DNA-binding protein
VLPAIAPDGAVSLVFDRLAGRLAVIGPRTVPGAFVVHPGDCWWGVRFWPGAGPGVLGPVSLETVRNRTVWADETPLDAWRARLLAALTAATTADEARTIWDQAIARHLAAADAIDRDVLTAARLIVRARGDVTVREVIAATGISPRQLRRRFLAAAGLTPKELIRTRRIRASLLDAVAAEAPSWSEIAAARGFSDQSHLVREVRRAIGITPAALHPYLRRVTYGGIVDY